MWAWLSSPSVSGVLEIDGVPYEAEGCRGFRGGVMIDLAGEGSHSVSAALVGDSSMRVTFDGQDVGCEDAHFNASEGTVVTGRRGPGNPVIGGRFTLQCQTSDGRRLHGAFDFARCRQD